MGPNGQRASSNQAPAGPVVTPAPQVEPAGVLHLMPLQSMSQPLNLPLEGEPPAKKPKLRLSVRSQSEESPAPSVRSGPAPGASTGRARESVPIEDSIEVVKSRRGSNLRIRYSENMQLDDPNLRQDTMESSELSSIASTSPPPPAEKQLRERRPSASANLEYGDFMNYYILDGDDDVDDNAKGPAPVSEPKPKPVRHPKSQSQKATRQKPIQHQHPPPQLPPSQLPQKQMPIHGPPRQPPKLTNPPHPPPPTHYPAAPRPMPPPLPLPQVQLIDFEALDKSNASQMPCTVIEMVQKLEALSAALTQFGGVPPIPKSPNVPHHPNVSGLAEGTATNQPPTQSEKQQRSKKPQNLKQPSQKKGDALDALLGMFEDEEDDADDEAEDEVEEPPLDEHGRKLNYALDHPGESDGPLTYGIQFIQNALKSWAQQRITHTMHPELQRQAQLWAQQQAQMKKRGPGRPRKFTEAEERERAAKIPTLPPPVQIKADSTPEGIAVKAFQSVLECGCLQVNAILPAELTRALRHLYMQIDHLINQGAKNEQTWQCLSYGAQIAANKTRVEKWKEAQAKAHEEMARQHQLAQQQVMQQMGLSVHLSGQLSPVQIAHQHALELERRRSQQHAAQQPYISHHHLNPLLLGSQPPGTPTGFAPSPSPANAQVQQPGLSSDGSNPNALPLHGSPVNANLQHLEKVKMYVPGYMPRSGTQMKFSFTPTNENALKVFGPQAFPTPPPPGNIPNRGPMSASHAPPLLSTTPADIAVTPPTVARSIEIGRKASGHAHQIDGPVAAESRGKARTSSSADDGTAVEIVGANPQSPDRAPVLIKKEFPASPALAVGPKTTGFTAVNAQARPICVPAVPSPSQAPNGIPDTKRKDPSTISKNRNGSDMAAKFPHPGAVVVDQ